MLWYRDMRKDMRYDKILSMIHKICTLYMHLQTAADACVEDNSIGVKVVATTLDRKLLRCNSSSSFDCIGSALWLWILHCFVVASCCGEKEKPVATTTNPTTSIIE